ncbi:MAG: polyprenyl synthetase family protein [Clostridia bacterium]|jgi:geranylgeranyl diphosphate synthase type II|nr:polyprenyl synthetase family protein [Clostridia bacterium]
MKIEEYLRQKALLVEEALFRFLPEPTAYPPVIHEAMHYSLSAGGKRLRPILALAAGEAVGADDCRPMLPLACALEYIHTYSLIHDDLPAMDDDDFRRGKPSCHKVFGEGMAILAGDALLTYAFELLTKLAAPEGAYQEALVIKVIGEISRSIGTQGLIGGQVVDLQSEGIPIDINVLEYIHRHKTGALFKTSILTGAMLGGAKKQQLENLAVYADLLGLAFQITDDILDVEGDAALIGKPTGSDAKKQKATYPGLLGMEQARNVVEECVTKSLEVLACFSDKAEPLRLLMSYIKDRNL